MLNKVISFAIWGNNPLYINGMYENIRLAPEIYPDWKVWVYIDGAVPQEAITKMQNDGAKVIWGEHANDTITKAYKRTWEGLFWRFYPASDPEVDVVIVRDADSRINYREQAAVNEWLSSNFTFHGMRDNWNHNVPIMGGMWGAKKGAIPDMRECIRHWHKYRNKGTDQTFLQNIIWENVRKKAMVHDRHCYGFYKLPDGELLNPDKVATHIYYDNCGDEKDYNFPRGKIVLKDGRIFQRLDVYHYDPIYLFGHHDLRPFPGHKPLEYGTYVGQSSLDF